MTIVTQQISGQFSPKLVAAYMKKAHKEADIRVQPCAEDESALYLADGMACLKVPKCIEFAMWMNFPQDWERVTFKSNEIVPHEFGVDCAAFFRSWGTMIENHVLTLTNDLREIPGACNKPGTLYRKLTWQSVVTDPADEALTWTVYIEKRLLDIFSPDLDELNGFLFETSGQHKPVRVSAVNGIVGYVMPGYNIEREWVR